MTLFAAKSAASFLLGSLLSGLLLLQSPAIAQSVDTAEAAQPLLPQYNQRYVLGEMTALAPLQISGVNTMMTIGFGGRLDRVVSAAELRLNYHVSPAIADQITQVRVLLNNEITAVIPLQAAQAGSRQSRTVRLDPRLFSSYNELRFELLGETTHGLCTSASPSAWFELARDSSLQVTYQQLKVANELSYFPEPWFDRRDFGRARIELMLPADPDLTEVEAAGVLASYFGMKADWRELNFALSSIHTAAPTLTEDWQQRWPEAHVIVLTTNADKPWALRDLADVQQAEIRVIDNPAYPTYKALLIRAPDPQQLRAAVATLVTHDAGLSGAQATIATQPQQPREAYQAPRWLPLDRPVLFKDLVEQASELERTASNRSPITIALRLPPDLFTWQKYGIPVDLKFRYTPPIVRDESRMLVSVNNEFIKGFTLNESGTENTQERLRVPILEGSLFNQGNVTLPSFKLAAMNQLQFTFSFGSISDSCKVAPLANARGAIDGTSSIDLRGYDHYVALPDVHLYAKTGYPFSRHDDLLQTRVVVPAVMSEQVLQTTLLSVAKIAAATGYPTTGLQLRLVEQLDASEDADILIVGHQALADWFKRFGASNLSKQLAGYNLAAQQQLLFDPQLALENSGPSAAVVSFASPLAQGRTVVALTATTDSYLTRVQQALNSAEQTNQFHGFMTVITPARVQSFDTVVPYYVGTLGWWNQFTYHLAQYPLVVTFLALLAVVVLALMLFRIFSAKAKRRNEQQKR